ncbi:MAG: hypothetical protein KG003_03310 [Bacteroidetes bacterium]|nr:hypothetical protein [Bacteroidota bacterium]
MRKTHFLWIFWLFIFSTCKKKVPVQANVVFWQDKQTATKYSKNGLINELVVFLAGRRIGSISAGSYYGAEPECGANGVLTCLINFDDINSVKEFPYQLQDQKGNILEYRNIKVNAWECNHLKLE